MDKPVLTQVKAILKSLVLSCPDKITVEQLNRDYRDVEGRLIPFRQLGYGNLEEFLRSVPDTLRVFGSGPTAMVCFVANEKSDHIHDMIMRQKKAKPKARSRFKSPAQKRNNAFQGNSLNTFSKKKGQQLSPYQNVNRNQMTKTLQVKPMPQVTRVPNFVATPLAHMQRANFAPILLSNQILYNLTQSLPQVTHMPNYGAAPLVHAQRGNYESIHLSNQILCNLPQPNGILPIPVQSTIKNGIAKTINDQIYQNQINQITSLLKNQCTVGNRTPPPPLPTQQNIMKKTSSFTTTKPSEQVNKVVEKGNANKFNNIDRSPKKTETLISLTQIKPPTEFPAKKELSNIEGSSEKSERAVSLTRIKPPSAKKQLSIKFLEDVQDISAMPKLSRVTDCVEESSKNFIAEESQKVDENNSKTKASIKKNQPRRFFDDSSESVEDTDEAIPSFAAKNNVFRLDFPEHTFSYGNKIAPYKLSQNITVESYIKIFVTEIHSPFKFWFHIHEENHQLDTLMYQMERYYSSLDLDDLSIPKDCLTPGQVCAACYNGMWHRAEIVAPPLNKRIKVSFIDYGTVTEVEIENVKFLAKFFGELPAQALRGCLSHIKPCAYHWSHEATSYFLTLVEELMLYAKVAEIDKEKNILYMILCDTNGEEVVQINTSLVKSGLADYNEDWKAKKIKENNGKRLHHPREDFPTFSMIESGEYPSFHELVSLLQRGINYENIYDLILFNQSTILNKHECASESLRNLSYFLTTSNPFRSDILLELHATTSKAL